MNYEFPRIVHISQVLDAIKGDEDKFLVIDKGDFTVINYILPCNQTFPPVTDRDTAIRRELRGIKFDNKTGEIIARPFGKFFNVGEREETLLPNIDISKPYWRLEKLDGSLIHPIMLGGGIRWCTKAGITDTSMQVEVYLAQGNRPGIEEFCDVMIQSGYTPIFEWCSRKNRIVIDYPEDRLVFTAIRDNISGQYWSLEEMEAAGNNFKFEVVGIDRTPITSIVDYVTSIHDKTGDLDEGEVLRFHDGHMVKVKRKDYVNLHRTKDKIRKERNLVAVMLSSGLDDLKPFMIDEDLAKAEIYEYKLNINLSMMVGKIISIIETIKESKMSRKDFALGSETEPLSKQIIFSLWDRNFPISNIHEDLMKKLKDSCESDQKFERLRNTLLKGCEW